MWKRMSWLVVVAVPVLGCDSDPETSEGGSATDGGASAGGADEGGASQGGTSAGGDGQGGSGEGGSATCTVLVPQPFIVGQGLFASYISNGTQALMLTVINPLGGAEPDYLGLYYSTAGIALDAGTYTLGEAPFLSTSYDPMVFAGEDFDGQSYNRSFAPVAGTLTLEIADAAFLGASKGSLDDVRLDEIDAAGDFVVNGDCLTIAHVDWDSTGGTCGTGTFIVDADGNIVQEPQDCINDGACCDEFVACQTSTACMACLVGATSVGCATDPELTAFQSCFDDAGCMLP